MMKRYIKVDKTVKAKLSKLFHVDERCIRNALTFRQNNDLAKRMRIAAVENGGRLMVDGVQEDGTWFTGTPGCPESPHMMHMALPNEVIIEVHTSDGHADVIKDGEVVRSYQNVKVSDLTAIREVALSL